MKLLSPILLYIILFVYCAHSYKKKRLIVEKKISAKYDNPNYVRDRLKYEIDKPELIEIQSNNSTNTTKITIKHHQSFHPSYMDYCAPYHCNDYHRAACGLNRDSMRFKWFQSACHIILNNKCASYRGNLKYDIVDTKFCTLYVMQLRSNCPTSCADDDPVCAIGSTSGHVMLFRSGCALEMVNCQTEIPEFEEVKMSICEYYLLDPE